MPRAGVVRCRPGRGAADLQCAAWAAPGSGVADPRRRRSARSSCPLSATGARHPLARRASAPARHPAARERARRRAQALLERQWREYWAMTVEPQAHPSPVPLDLVDGFETLVALPSEGAAELRDAIVAHAAEALAFAQSATRAIGDARQARHRVSRVCERDRRARAAGRPAGALVRAQRAGAAAQAARRLVDRIPHDRRHRRPAGDVVAFDAAIHPIIAELA